MSGKKTSRGSEAADQSWELKDIQQLIDLLIEREVAEFEMEKDGVRIRILRRESRGPASAAPASTNHAVPAISDNHFHTAPAPASEPAALQLGTAEPAKDMHVMKSPMVGTFFTAPAPDAPSFVTLGDTVEVGQVLCIVEAMKLMNEIESEVAGEIARIHAENGQPVEYGQPLFDIKPSKPK
jgi:acetyl-CoA carboxylase biotin carboxyl carrier protein